jgi:hypothetical protein
MITPQRCEECARDKYSGATRKKLLKELPILAKGYRPSMMTFTLGTTVFAHEHDSDTQGIALHSEIKQKFRKMIQSKWWKNRVNGVFYTIEVKETKQEDGRVKLHPHVHAIVLHPEKQEWTAKAVEYGLGSYVYCKRIRGGLHGRISYVLKYALKYYGDPLAKGRYYERTGAFRKSTK